MGAMYIWGGYHPRHLSIRWTFENIPKDAFFGTNMLLFFFHFPSCPFKNFRTWPKTRDWLKCGLWAAGHRLRAAGCWPQIAGCGYACCGPLIAGCGLRATDCGLRVAGHRLRICGLRAIDRGLRVAGHRLWAAGMRAASHRLQAPGGYSTLSWVRMCGPKFRPPPYNKTREDANLLPISNHSFLEGPFLKPISAFYNVNWDA